MNNELIIELYILRTIYNILVEFCKTSKMICIKLDIEKRNTEYTIFRFHKELQMLIKAH